VTLLTVIEFDPLLVRVTAFCAPMPPTVTEAQLSEVGLTEALPPEPLLPVPESATVWGLFVASSEMLSVAARAPLTLGLKVREMVQLEDALRLDPQVLLEMVKSPGDVPVTAILLMVMTEPVPLLSVVVCAELDEPTSTDPKEREVGLTVTDPPVPPGAKPDNATVCGLGLAESLKFKVAVRVPLDFGANVMFAVQLAFAARDEPQVFEKILKSAGFAPESVTLVIVITLPLLFVRVTTFCAPMPPTATDAQLRLVGDTEAAEANAVKIRKKKERPASRIDCDARIDVNGTL
jgi:hypothetical protein